MTLSVIIGAGLLALGLFYVGFNLKGRENARGEDEHSLLRTFLIIVGLTLILLIIPKTAIDEAQGCELQVNNTLRSYAYINYTETLAHDNATGFEYNETITKPYLVTINETYEYDRVCVALSTTTDVAFYEFGIYVLAAFWLYILAYLVWRVLGHMRELYEEYQNK